MPACAAVGLMHEGQGEVAEGGEDVLGRGPRGDPCGRGGVQPTGRARRSAPTWRRTTNSHRVSTRNARDSKRISN